MHCVAKKNISAFRQESLFFILTHTDKFQLKFRNLVADEK